MTERKLYWIIGVVTLVLCAGWELVYADDYQTADRLERMQVTDTVPPPPKPYVWEGARPAGAPWGIPCSVSDATVVAQSLIARGANDSDIVYMLGVIGRESGCRYWVHNYNRPTRDDSYSLCQANAMAGHFGSNGVLAGWDRYRMLADMKYAADACAQMWATCGRGPWNAGNYYCEPPH
jgi:hypothetical protein